MPYRTGRVRASASGLISVTPTGPPVGFYVSTSGNDANNGSIDSPWQTILFALTQVTAGSTLWLRGGTHNAAVHQAGTTAWNSGSSFADAITIRPYPGESATIASQLGYQHSSAASYHIWIDLLFNAATNGAIYGRLGAHHIRFQNCEITGATGQGVHQADSTPHHWEFLTCNVHHNGSVVNLDHGLYLGGASNLIEGCEIHHNFAHGFQFFPQGSDNIVRKCRIYSNGKMGAHFDTGSGNQFYNNLVYSNTTNGLSFNSQGGTVVYFNTFYSNGNYGIEQTGSGTNTARNNIFYQNAGGALNVLGGSITQSNNSSNATNPQFVNAASGDFHLTASTPLSILDAGVSIAGITTDFEGDTRSSTPDVGAYEYP